VPPNGRYGTRGIKNAPGREPPISLAIPFGRERPALAVRFTRKRTLRTVDTGRFEMNFDFIPGLQLNPEAMASGFDRCDGRGECDVTPNACRSGEARAPDMVARRQHHRNRRRILASRDARCSRTWRWRILRFGGAARPASVLRPGLVDTKGRRV